VTRAVGGNPGLRLTGVMIDGVPLEAMIAAYRRSLGE
jgi:hypothetical protein